MTTYPTPEDITIALEALGDTPEKVVDTLRRQGIKGQRLNGRTCLITNALQVTFPGTKFHTGHLVAISLPKGSLANLVKVNLPESVQRVVARFDGGHLPDLEEDE
jgi:hypothetical protein